MHCRRAQDKDAGNLTERFDVRKRLNCKSFKWFLENVYPEKFIPDEDVQAYGMVSLCLLITVVRYLLVESRIAFTHVASHLVGSFAVESLIAKISFDVTFSLIGGTSFLVSVILCPVHSLQLDF